LNIKKEALKRKVNPERIVFAGRVPMDEHLARQRLADLFIDTFSFNAHTTAAEALWAGVPIVTRMGQGFASRVAGSLLKSVGLPELITTNEHDYEMLILELATKPSKLQKIRQKLAANRLEQPLFDTEQYTKHIEDGFQKAYQNYCAGNTPQTIFVQK
jgi:predicted O-linked N-acetylglucosamine transferase (SPINDLY family)